MKKKLYALYNITFREIDAVFEEKYLEKIQEIVKNWTEYEIKETCKYSSYKEFLKDQPWHDPNAEYEVDEDK